MADPGTARVVVIHDTAVEWLGWGSRHEEVTMAGRASGAGLIAAAGAILVTTLIAPRPAGAAPRPESRSEPETEIRSAPPSVKAALEAFHLVGRWAVRCDAPRGTDNWYGTYTVAPNGEGQLVFSAGEGRDNIYIIEDARRLSAVRLQLSESFNGETFDVVLRFDDGHYRTEDVRRPDGSYQVKGGRFVGTNGRTSRKSSMSPMMSRCADADGEP